MKDKIIEAIKDDSLVLFVGAGMSMPLNYPNWDDLIQNILKEIEEDHAFNFPFYIKQGKNIDVFKVLDELEHHKLVAKVREELYNQINSIEIDKSKLNKHKKLWELSEKIITTNYDKVLEEVKPRKVDVFSNGNEFKQSKSIQGSPFLYKIHGDITNPDTCILFSSDYKELYESDTSDLSTLKSILLNKTILFIGFSLNDPFVNKQMEYLSDMYKGHNQKHYVLQTKPEDFSKFNVKSFVIKDWNQSFDNLLDELIKIKSETSTSLTVIEKVEDEVDINDIKNLVLLEEMLAEKKEDFDNSEDIKKKAISKEMHTITNRMKELFSQKLNLNFLENIPEHQEAELEQIFETIFQSEKLSSQTLQQIDKIRDQNSKSYEWYHRSVIVSSLACSLINHKKVDPKKIDLIIDFTNDSEDKVWQKAISYLFLILNHLGNKWLRFNQLKSKLATLKSNLKIQNALNFIITSVQLEAQNISPINEKIFENEYFKDSPFNYFLPFYDDNPSIDRIYDDTSITNIEKFLEFLKNTPLPDSFKYLICNSEANKKIESSKLNSDQKDFLDYMLSVHHSFEPYLNYVNELLNFYQNYPKIDKVLNEKTSVIGFKNLKSHLLSTEESHRAMGRHFQIENKFDQAAIHYKQLLEINNNDLESILNLARCYESLNKEEKEILSLRLQAEKINPNNHDNLDEISSLLIEMEDYQRAIEYSNRAIDLFKNNQYYFLHRGIAKTHLNYFDEAIDDFKYSLDIKTSDYAYYRMANAYYGLQKYDEALKQINKAIEIDENQSGYFVIKANIYRMTDRTSEAFTLIEEVLKIDNKHSIAIGTKAAIFSTIGNDEKFYFWLEKSFQLNAKAKWLHNDVIEKYKKEIRFINLLKKYEQEL